MLAQVEQLLLVVAWWLLCLEFKVNDGLEVLEELEEARLVISRQVVI